MQTLWLRIQRYSRQIVIFPTLLGVVVALLTGHTIWLAIGAVWFLSVIAAVTAIEMILAVRRKLPRRKRDALAEFLQTGGYSITAVSLAAYFSLAFWTRLHAKWLVWLMFGGILMCFSSGLVYKARPRKTAQHN